MNFLPKTWLNFFSKTFSPHLFVGQRRRCTANEPRVACQIQKKETAETQIKAQQQVPFIYYVIRFWDIFWPTRQLCIKMIYVISSNCHILNPTTQSSAYVIYEWSCRHQSRKLDESEIPDWIKAEMEESAAAEVKFIYSEKATKIWLDVQIWFDVVTISCYLLSSKIFVIFLWPSQNIYEFYSWKWNQRKRKARAVEV